MIPLRDDNPSDTVPFVTIAIIAACVLVFLWEIGLGERALGAAIFSYGAIPATLTSDAHLPSSLYRISPWLATVTSMFLHGGWMHLIGNMLYLWIFGDNVEDALGHLRYVVFYVVCGLAAVAAQTLMNPASTVPMVGASGAISGVLGAYLLLFPRAHVLVLIPLGFFTRLIYLPAVVMLGFWILLQVVSSAFARGQEGGGVAFAAHVGGFVAGMVLVPLFKRRGVRLFAPAQRR
jgi:membrane associated rhomboid family serine protease